MSNIVERLLNPWTIDTDDGELEYIPIKIGTEAADEIERLRTIVAKLEKVLSPLVKIADAYDDNALDDEARKFWGINDERENKDDPATIELYTGRGGRRLLTLADCLSARDVTKAERKVTT